MIRLLRTLRLCTLAGVLLLPLARADRPSLVELVDDRTVVALHLRDLPAQRAAFASTPYAKLLADPDFQAFIAPGRALLDGSGWRDAVRDATEFTPEDLLALFTGDVLAVIEQPYRVVTEDMDGHEWPVTLMAHVEGNRIEPLLQKFAEHFVRDGGSRDTERHAGVTLHIETPSPDADDDFRSGFTHPLVWAIHEGVLFFSDNRPAVEAGIDALQGRRIAAPFARSDVYEEVLARNPEAGLIGLIRPDKFLPLYQDALTELVPGGAGMLGGLGLDGAGVARLLGLEAWQSVYFSTGLDAEKASLNMGVTYREALGLFRLMAYRDGPLTYPDWVPASWFDASTMNFDFKEAYTELERLVESFNPMFLAIMQQQILTMGQQIGVDIRRDLIGNFGDVVLSGQSIPPDQTMDSFDLDQVDQVLAFSLLNTDGFRRAIDTLKIAGGPMVEQFLESRDYLGQTLFVFNPPVPPEVPMKRVSYAIVDGWWLVGIGSTRALEPVLQQLDSRRDSFWRRDEVAASLNNVPRAAVGYQFSDLRVTLLGAMRMVVNFQNQDGGDDRLIDPAAMPSASKLAPYFGFVESYVVKEPRGLHIHAVAPHAQP